MPHFTYNESWQDSIAPYFETDSLKVSIFVQPVANEEVYLESLMVWDGRFYDDDIDPGWPRHVETADTVWLCLTARVIGPDLKANSIEFEPYEIGQDNLLDDVQFEVVETKYVAFDRSFTVELKQYRPPPVNSDTVLYYTTLNSLPAGQSFVDKVSGVPMYPCGDHRFTLTVTPVGEPDADPSNDELIEYYHVLAPDLEAQSLTASANPIRKGEEITISFSYGEAGIADVPDSFSVYLTDLNIEGLWSDHPDSINEGVFRDSSITWFSHIPGNHTIELRVDPESNPDGNVYNNTRTLQIEVLYQPLHAHPLPFTPNNDSYNDTLYFDFGDDTFTSPRASIFTLDGRLVITLTKVENNALVWMGKDKSGNLCLPGAYLYTFEDAGRKVSSGLVYVAR